MCDRFTDVKRLGTKTKKNPEAKSLLFFICLTYHRLLKIKNFQKCKRIGHENAPCHAIYDIVIGKRSLKATS